MNKDYLIKNFIEQPDKTAKVELIFVSSPRELLLWQDKNQGAKYAIYECECLVDWS